MFGIIPLRITFSYHEHHLDECHSDNSCSVECLGTISAECHSTECHSVEYHLM